MAPSDSKILGSATIWDRGPAASDVGEAYNLTSKLYPIELYESLEASALVDVTYGVAEIESLASSAMLLSGSLKHPLINYTWPAENIAATAAITTSSLEQILLQYTWPPESIGVSASLTESTLDIILIRYTNWPAENISNSAELTGGTLV